MIRIAHPCRTLAATALAASLAASLAAQRPEPATPLTIPAFCGYAHPDANAIRRDRKTGGVHTCDGELHFYFELAGPGELQLTLLRDEHAKQAHLRLSLQAWPEGAPVRSVATGTAGEPCDFGSFHVAAGVHRVVIRAVDDAPLRDLQALRLGGTAAASAHASTVERRNASSVHLGYEVPAAHRDDIEWFYCELTPETDPLWTYYMATGWRRGYFGMQVNSPTERRVIFSVWDSGNEAVDRNKVKAEDLVQLVRKGDAVHAGGFGNEGTGGHSHLVHDWQLGDTLRFLVRAEPDADRLTTTYTGWFSHVHSDRRDAPDAWRLVASFRAPKDGRRLHGLYSFSENFSGSNGDAKRRCRYGNVWARTHGGEWLPLTTARFTHDGHGDECRRDRRGGVEGGVFFLEHGGFATAPMRRRTKLSLDGPTGAPPASLPE